MEKGLLSLVMYNVLVGAIVVAVAVAVVCTQVIEAKRYIFHSDL